MSGVGTGVATGQSRAVDTPRLLRRLTTGLVLVGLLVTLGPGDRTTVNDYVDSMREVERRIQAVEKTGA